MRSSWIFCAYWSFPQRPGPTSTGAFLSIRRSCSSVSRCCLPWQAVGLYGTPADAIKRGRRKAKRVVGGVAGAGRACGSQSVYAFCAADPNARGSGKKRAAMSRVLKCRRRVPESGRCCPCSKFERRGGQELGLGWSCGIVMRVSAKWELDTTNWTIAEVEAAAEEV